MLILFSKCSFFWRDFYLFLLLLQHLLAVCSSLHFHLRALRLTKAVLAVTSGVGVAVRLPAWRMGSSLDGELGTKMLVAAHTFSTIVSLILLLHMYICSRCCFRWGNYRGVSQAALQRLIFFSIRFLHGIHCFVLTGKPSGKRKPVGCTFEDKKP